MHMYMMVCMFRSYHACITDAIPSHDTFGTHHVSQIACVDKKRLGESESRGSVSVSVAVSALSSTSNALLCQCVTVRDKKTNKDCYPKFRIQLQNDYIRCNGIHLDWSTNSIQKLLFGCRSNWHKKNLEYKHATASPWPSHNWTKAHNKSIVN